MTGPRMTGPRAVPSPDPAPTAGCGHLSTVEIEALLEGRLDPVRRAGFEAHAREGCGACALLAADAALFAETTAPSERFSEEERDGAERDRAAVEEWLARRERPRAVRWGTLALLAAAASVALVAVLVPRGPSEPPTGFVLPLADGSTQSVGLLPFSAPGVQRGAPDLSDLWSAAGEAYRKGSFDEAAERFAGIAERAPDDSDALLYQGIALSAERRFAEAATVLDRASERATRSGTNSPALAWYRAVALAGAGRSEDAVPILEVLVREAQESPAALGETDYGKLASDLLSHLSGTPPKRGEP